MSKGVRAAAACVVIVVVLVAGVGFAQSALTLLGLSESAARAFLLDEIKGPTSHGRRSEIAVAGTRAFYRLPPAARGPAATGLFAWAKAYVSSPAFMKAYADLRGGAVPQQVSQADTKTVDEEAKERLDAMLASFEDAKKMAATLEPAERARMLEMVKDQEAQLRTPESEKMLRATLEAERVERGAGISSAALDANERYPADPKQLFARRLRQFLEETAGANFSAKTISLTGGADGIEFVDPADRTRSWLWQLAVIAGPEAVTAARVAADAWLKEIAR